ncbi:hypothetical protein WR25_17275 [Diploscapter pachys]|uniref:Uncharacterized protein n=1 Tax=Diploscapter pachys TaxID=2018661 RepID=A0A2A2K875_9BILA|nr:hypothetical protein WR25_17275 [Diploscapter pachys]
MRMPRRACPLRATGKARVDRDAGAVLVEEVQRRAGQRRIGVGLDRKGVAGHAIHRQPIRAGHPHRAQVDLMDVIARCRIVAERPDTPPGEVAPRPPAPAATAAPRPCSSGLPPIGERGRGHHPQKIAMCRQPLGGVRIAAPHRLHCLGDQSFVQRVCGRLPGRWHQPLAQAHRDPARHAEQIVTLAEQPPLAAPQLQLAGQAVRQRHGADAIPEWRVGPPGLGIMQDDEVADVLVQIVQLAVEFVAFGRVEARVGEHRDDPLNARLDQMDAGRFERFDEAARQPQRDDVAVPALPPPSRGEAQAAGIAQRLALEAGEKIELRRLVGQEFAAIDIAVAHPVLQRDTPLPAGRTGGGTGVRIGLARTGQRTRHRHRPVARQPLRIALIARVQRLLDQQPAKAGTVDKQVARHLPPVDERQGLDIAILAPQPDVGDPPLDPRHPAALGVTAQIARIERGIEMIGVEQLAHRRARIFARSAEPPARRRLRAHRPGGDVRNRPTAALAQPQLVEGYALQILPEGAERMDVAIADRAPVAKFDAELERACGRREELVFVDPQHPVEIQQRRDGRFADADRTDLFRFDQRDARIAGVEQARERGGGHPAGGAAADDDDTADGMVGDGQGHRARRLACAASQAAWVGACGSAAAMASVMPCIAACASASGTASAKGSIRRGRIP